MEVFARGEFLVVEGSEPLLSKSVKYPMCGEECLNDEFTIVREVFESREDLESAFFCAEVWEVEEWVWH